MRDAVLAATLAALRETRYRDMTVDLVAQRARVAKTTIYRRWGSTEGLVLDLLRDQTARRVPIPDTGELARDLHGLARSILTAYQDPALNAVVSSVVSAAVYDPEARQTLSEFFITRITETSVIAERAVRRGELPADTDTVEVIRMLTAPFYYRMFITGEPIDEALAYRAAAAAGAAARAGALVRGG